MSRCGDNEVGSAVLESFERVIVEREALKVQVEDLLDRLSGAQNQVAALGSELAILKKKEQGK